MQKVISNVNARGGQQAVYSSTLGGPLYLHRNRDQMHCSGVGIQQMEKDAIKEEDTGKKGEMNNI